MESGAIMAIEKSRKNLHGINVLHSKNTKNIETIKIPVPKTVSIPMLQHMGIPCTPLISKGDYVYMGQKIGESNEFFSVPIHSSCSGTVSDIIDYHSVNDVCCKTVLIETDGLQKLDPGIEKPQIDTKEQFIESIKQSGLVGLGGAGFPTFIKFAYKDIDRVNKLVINAAECEPYITTDYRECMENTDNIVGGINLLKKFLNIKDVYIGIEDNKPKAIEKLKDAFSSDDNVTVVRLKTIYPQGAEKSIIYATTGIVVEEGKLPADCGVIVSNVSTVGFIGNYMSNGIPLISRRITVDGDKVTHPSNLLVPIGTNIRDVLDYCQITDDYGKVLMGGPMMGITVLNIDSPVIKNNNAIIVLSKELSQPMVTTDCIRCSKCIVVCPMRLMPAKLEKAYDNESIELLNQLAINLCINCGCCTYICPAKRHLAQKNQLAKILVKNKK